MRPATPPLVQPVQPVQSFQEGHATDTDKSLLDALKRVLEEIGVPPDCHKFLKMIPPEFEQALRVLARIFATHKDGQAALKLRAGKLWHPSVADYPIKFLASLSPAYLSAIEDVNPEWLHMVFWCEVEAVLEKVLAQEKGRKLAADCVCLRNDFHCPLLILDSTPRLCTFSPCSTQCRTFGSYGSIT